jgi:hypothetical protein
MEKVCKLSCQCDYFETSVWGKIDSSLIVYILFKDSKLKIAVNKPQFNLQFSAL